MGWGMKFFRKKKHLCRHEELKVSQLCWLHAYVTSKHELLYGTITYTKAELHNKDINKKVSINIHFKPNAYNLKERIKY